MVAAREAFFSEVGGFFALKEEHMNNAEDLFLEDNMFPL